MSRFIQIVEVGARDGLQNEKAILEPMARVELIRRLEACGVRRQEVVSFVNPARVPQMAGAETIMAALPSEAGRSRMRSMNSWPMVVPSATSISSAKPAPSLLMKNRRISRTSKK